MRGVKNVAEVLVGDLADRTPGRNAGLPEGLRLPEVPDAGNEPLVEQPVADGAAVVTAQVRDHRGEIGRLLEDVGPEPPDGAVVELQHGAVPQHGFALRAAKDEPGTPHELRPAGADLPAARHAEVAAQDDAVLEAEEQVLSRRLDSEQHAAVEAFGKPLDRRTRMRRLDLDPLADEYLQPTRSPRQGIAFGHSCQATRVPTQQRFRSAAAGAAAATVWGLLEPIDQRVFRCDYSDIALLGKGVTRGRHWRATGFALHALNGAVFGLVFDAVRRRVAVEPRRLALGMALTEHACLYPVCYFVDRYHPARGEEGVPPLLTNPRAFGQATVRHAVFGLTLGQLVRGGERLAAARQGSRPRRAGPSRRSP